jgi:hypothetical protein
MCFVLVFAAVAAGGVFAQSAKHWISGGYNTGTFITGGMQANYEFLFHENFSATAQVGTRWIIFPQILVGARWYPWGGGNSNPDIKFHVDAEMGYSRIVAPPFGFEGGVGWKFDLGEPNKFFLDLGLVTGIPILAGLEIDLGWAF